MIFNNCNDFLNFISECPNCHEKLLLTAHAYYAKVGVPVEFKKDEIYFKVSKANISIDLTIDVYSNKYMTKTNKTTLSHMPSLSVRKVVLRKECVCEKFLMETNPLEFDRKMHPLTLDILSFSIQLDKEKIYLIVNSYSNKITTITKIINPPSLFPSQIDIPLVEFNFTDFEKLKNRIKTLLVFA